MGCDLCDGRPYSLRKPPRVKMSRNRVGISIENVLAPSPLHAPSGEVSECVYFFLSLPLHTLTSA
jgi:hypothetical protein